MAEMNVIPGDFPKIARAFVRTGNPIVHYRSDFYEWTGTIWRVITLDALRARLYPWLEGKSVATESTVSSYKPDIKKVANVVAALAAVTQLEDTLEAPFWIEARPGDPDPIDLLPFENGVLDLKTFALLPSDPRLFAMHHVRCAYDPAADAPAWVAFLGSSFPADEELACRHTIEEMIGYSLTADRRLQKIAVLFGKARSGKGTIGSVLKALLGIERYAGPSVAAFANDFGLQALIGAQVAVIADARDQSRWEPNIVVERLLSISGQDTLSVNRKNKEFWKGQLGCQVWWMSNILPKFRDPSGTIITRLVVIKFRELFLGREDPHLLDKLKGELPGIVNRAIAGLKRLRERGNFVQPETGEEVITELARTAHTVITWLDDNCVMRPDAAVNCTVAYNDFVNWCKKNGHPVPSSTRFGIDLRAAGIVGFDRKLKGAKGKQTPHYLGFEIKLDYDENFDKFYEPHHEEIAKNAARMVEYHMELAAKATDEGSAEHHRACADRYARINAEETASANKANGEDKIVAFSRG